MMARIGLRQAGLFLFLAVAVQADRSLNGRLGYGELQEDWVGEVEQLSWRPRLYLMRHFLSDEECDHIIGLAKGHLEGSSVLDNDSGAWKKSESRTSTGAMFGRGYDDVLRKLEKRIASITMIPVEHQEGWQVLHYEHGQQYKVHSDAFHDKLNQRDEMGGQRVVTVLMYLSTPEEGGETVFPFADQRVQGPGWSECARQGLAHHPQKGDAVMFYSLSPDGEVDLSSQHGSCPTLKGEKWSATKWIHVKPFGVASKVDPNGCNDNHEHCREWAFFGECESNPGYMLVNCRVSCKTCDKNPAELAAAVETATAAAAAKEKAKLKVTWSEGDVGKGTDEKEQGQQQQQQQQRLATTADGMVSDDALRSAVKVEVTRRTATT